jgi:hypothetical protein
MLYIFLKEKKRKISLCGEKCEYVFGKYKKGKLNGGFCEKSQGGGLNQNDFGNCLITREIGGNAVIPYF